MKYVDLEDVEIAFATMMNRLVFGKNKVLRPFLKALQESNQTEALIRLKALKEELEALSEKKNTIKGLFSQGIIEPAVYMQSTNVVVAQMERVTSEMDGISYIANGELSHIEEAKKLLDYAEQGVYLQDFDADIFEKYVDRIVVRSRNELEFQMKCGLKLIERI